MGSGSLFKFSWTADVGSQNGLVEESRSKKLSEQSSEEALISFSLSTEFLLA